MLKRCFDLFFSLLGLVTLTPLLICIALWIKMDSSGPVFFRQERVGRFCRPFKIYKFRTMCVNAERNGMQLTVGNDDRITTSGRFIRHYKLDELPQLFNVVLGEMSLVGPRPEVPRYVTHYPDDLKNLVLSVRPGITDFASIEFKDENRILAQAKDPELTYIKEILPIKLKHYQKYVQNQTVWLDMKLICVTIKAIIR